MTDDQNKEADDPNATWVHDTFRAAVDEVMNIGMIPDGLVEARAVWALPGRFVIGQVRDAGNPTSFYWAIAGEVPTDIIGAESATTAREAARYFSMKWQTFAAHLENPADRETLGMGGRKDWMEESAAMIARAEILYAVADDDGYWPPPPGDS